MFTGIFPVLKQGLQKTGKQALPQLTKGMHMAPKPNLGGIQSRSLSSGGRQFLLTQRAQQSRQDLADWFAAVKTSQQTWHDNTGMSTEYENLMAPKTLLRHDSDPTSPDAPHVEDKTTAKAHLDQEKGKLHPSGSGLHGDPSDPYGKSSGQQTLDHIRGRDKNDSPLISSTGGRNVTDLSGFGTEIEIDSAKAKVKPVRLTVAELLFNDLDDDLTKGWDWRKDLLLNLKSSEDVRKLEELMADHGIDPNAGDYARSEKMAVFALATDEHLIVGPTEEKAAKIVNG